MAVLDITPRARLSTQTAVIPQLVARASLLELSQDDIEERVKEEIDQNPVLELAQAPEPIRSTSSTVPGGGGVDALTQFPAPFSLRDDLMLQARAVCDPCTLPIVEYVIDNLDERGYLTASVAALADELELPDEHARAAIRIVQTLEPAGIGARDLPECLALQVARLPKGEAPPGLLEFIQGEFDYLVAQGDPKALRSPQSQGARVYLSFIAEHLYPYPADLFHSPVSGLCGEAVPTTPDAIVEEDNGRLRVTVPLSRQLALRIDATYERLERALAAQGAETDRRHVREMITAAKEFITDLAHRHAVIAQVTSALLVEQEDFLLHGPNALKPLTKKQLAKRLGMHESTICRATRGKSVLLPSGDVVPFDVFFEDALPAKVTLAAIVRQEDPARPLTDGQLCEELTARGYPVARRTVSKYRTCLGIPSASERRRRT